MAAHQLCNSLAVAAIAAVSLFPTSVWAQEEKAAAAETRPIDEEKTDAYLSRLIVALGEDESYKVRLQAAGFLGRSDDERAGRWAGTGKTECGLHTEMFQQKDLDAEEARKKFLFKMEF